ncbi:MAG: type I methionyl aminopeptidase [Candidatus Omnitrophica bacterium]|nr:type I methionyl aminopeptidase [Candidatus Omnitrophota bacterium]
MVEVKDARALDKMRKAGRIVGELLERLRETIAPGVTTAELDRLAGSIIQELGGQPAFKGYRGYPAYICTSINEEVVHGIPRDRVLKEGDIVGIDAGARVEGYYGDAAVTVAVGRVSEEARRLMEVTRQSLEEGIACVMPGRRLSDISHAVQTAVEKEGFSVVREFVGHGIGTRLHEPPQIPNYGPAGTGPVLKAGMVLAIEPMVNAGGMEVEILDDGWTAVTKDRLLSAHFEHTVAVTEHGPEILTLCQKKKP